MTGVIGVKCPWHRGLPLIHRELWEGSIYITIFILGFEGMLTKVSEVTNKLLFLFSNLPAINFAIQSLFALFYSTSFQWLVMTRAFSQEAVPSDNNPKNPKPKDKPKNPKPEGKPKNKTLRFEFMISRIHL